MRNDFSRVKRKILAQVLLIVAFAGVVGTIILNTLVDGQLQKPFADFFVWACMRYLNMADYEAISLYAAIFRSNKTLWLAGGFVVILLIGFYITLSRFTRYFNEIVRGVDKLTGDEQGDIVLPSELEFMEKKLTGVRDTLAKREAAAREAEQRKNDLVVYLAHDIKTPLTSVIGYLSLMVEAPDMPAEQRVKYLDLTLDKAYRLEALINEFFDITRFNLQAVVLNEERVNLHIMLMQIADEFYPALAARGNRAVVSVDPDLTITADPDKLARVINNIMKNALAYSESDTDIIISAGQSKGRVIIYVENVGEDIPPDKLEMIFEKFYRMDSARSSESGGAGLGLAIAKEIVAAHGGTITATSRENRIRFTVVLPRRSRGVRPKTFSGRVRTGATGDGA